MGRAGYRVRVLDRELDELLLELPAIAIEGPRGVGKTATAIRRARTVYRLDDENERAIARADPGRLTSGEPPILIDEWQRLPESWDRVRRAVDDQRPRGRFLLTGSAAPTHLPTHSGAGRIVTLRMRPMTLFERGVGIPSVSLRDLLGGRRDRVDGRTDVGLDEYAHELVASGFPAIRGHTERAVRAQLDGYLQRVIERDVGEAGREVQSGPSFTRWLAAYAAATATTTSYEKVRDAATAGQDEKPARATAARYLDALERLWLADPLPAWLPARNHLNRLAASPKHHLADPALAARALGVGAGGLLSGSGGHPVIVRDGPLLGALFESLVTLSVRVFAQAVEARVGHLRTRDGDHEVDLIVGRDDQRVIAIEVKLTRSVDDGDVRHLRWLADRMGPDLLDAVVVTTGPEAYRRRDGIAVVPAALLGP
jgi:uncharacterized protein